MGTKKEKIKATIASVFYRTSYNFLKRLETETTIEIDLAQKGNSVKGLYQLQAFSDSKPFLQVAKKDGIATVSLLANVEAKKVFVKLLAIGKAKFEAPIVFA